MLEWPSCSLYGRASPSTHLHSQVLIRGPLSRCRLLAGGLRVPPRVPAVHRLGSGARRGSTCCLRRRLARTPLLHQGSLLRDRSALGPGQTPGSEADGMLVRRACEGEGGGGVVRKCRLTDRRRCGHAGRERTFTWRRWIRGGLDCTPFSLLIQLAPSTITAASCYVCRRMT